MTAPLLALTFPDFAAAGRRSFLEARGTIQGSGVAGDLYGTFFRRGRWDPAGVGLPPASADLWERACDPAVPLAVEAVQADAGSGPQAQKVLFRTSDGLGIEAVLVPMESAGGRGTLCVSSQAGCAMACAFCETGLGGLDRNLTAAEITAQVHLARFALGWEFTSLVFMGMGEPLDNREHLFRALEVLTDPRGFAFAQDKITVCTVGLSEGIRALAARGWKRMGLSLSLNAGRDPLRQALMPVTRTNPLGDLKKALATYPQRKNFVLALNYCLLPGINDTEADAREVGAFARDLGRTLVNLIPYNPGTAPLTRAPDEAETAAFLELLRREGLDARVRGPKGRSIMAACGQLRASRSSPC